MNNDLLQIGEFAKCADTNLRTLRYYEELGLIRPAHRSSGKFRYYAPDQLKRVESIKRLQGLGLSLKEIQEIMVPPASEREDVLAHVAAGLDTQIGLVGQRVAALQAELDELRDARAKIEECKRCGSEFNSDACNGCARVAPAVMSVLRALA